MIFQSKIPISEKNIYYNKIAIHESTSTKVTRETFSHVDSRLNRKLIRGISRKN